MLSHQPVTKPIPADDVTVADFFDSVPVVDEKVLERLLDYRPDARVRRVMSATFRILGVLTRW
jgi:hypothetical protein